MEEWLKKFEVQKYFYNLWSNSYIFDDRKISSNKKGQDRLGVETRTMSKDTYKHVMKQVLRVEPDYVLAKAL